MKSNLNEIRYELHDVRKQVDLAYNGDSSALDELRKRGFDVDRVDRKAYLQGYSIAISDVIQLMLKSKS